MKKTSDSSGKPSVSRHKGRVLAFQGLYLWAVSEADPNWITSLAWVPEDEEDFPAVADSNEGLEFTRLLLAGTMENVQLIDGLIENNLKNWSLSRLNKVDLAILRVSTYGLKYLSSVPHSVTIDEAIEMAKMFSTDDSYRFINGVLDGVTKEIQGSKD